MSEVIVFIPINSVPVTERNKSTVLMVNYPFVKASDYDQLRKQLDEARELLKWATEWNWLDDDAPSRRRIDAWMEANP